LRAGFATDSVVFQKHGEQIRMRFLDANPNVVVEGNRPMSGMAHFLIGDQSTRLTTDAAIYRQVLYHELYAGIDLAYSGSGATVKSEFVVHPGSDVQTIRLQYPSDFSISLDPRGNLLVRGQATFLCEDAPTIYQNIMGKQVQIRGAYQLLGPHMVGFEVGVYDGTQPLIIDPVVTYATYLGGSSVSAVTGLAADGSGNLYVTGWTEALNFPIAGAVQAANGGDVDAFVVKFNPAGTGVLYATYIGGAGDDRGAGIAIDSSGNAYITGATTSTNFPTAAPAYATIGGTSNAFVLKLNAIGNALIYSTYLGGAVWDAGVAIAVDNSGNAHVAGNTQSANFPLVKPVQSSLGGSTDAFVAIFTPTGTCSFSTFLGGAGREAVGSIAVDTAGSTYVTGGTYSINFPTVSSLQSSNGGGEDVFITKFSAGGGKIIYSTYLGGSGTALGTSEQGTGIAVDASGAAYITGVTNSGNFPVNSGAFQQMLSGFETAFIAKLAPTGSALIYSTYLGGSGMDIATAVVVDSSGDAWVAGYTSSQDFPLVSALQGTFGGLEDAFIAELNPVGTALLFSTFYGGSGEDIATSLSLGGVGEMFVGGSTNSSNLQVSNSFQSSNNGSTTGWVLEINTTKATPSVASVSYVSPQSGSGNGVTFTAVYVDTAGASRLTTLSLLLAGSASSSEACYVSYSQVSGQFALRNALGASMPVTSSTSATNNECTLVGSGSTATPSGNTLTLLIALTFQTGFVGSQTIYSSAADAGSTTGWIPSGSWNVTGPPPTPSNVSVTPSHGSGAAQKFTFVFADTVNANNLTALAVLFQQSVTKANACYITYNPGGNTVSLLTNAGTASTSMALGSSGTIYNSQCTISSTSATNSGLSISLTLTVQFAGSFSGSQTIYMSAAEGGTSTGMIAMGVFNVSAGGAPISNAVVPSAGSGAANRFTFTISDKGGASFLTGGAILFASTLSTSNACYLVWDGTKNTIALTYDNPAAGQTPFTPGTTGIATNEQCTMNAANSTISMGTTQVFITLDLTFNSTFFGAKNVYLYAAETTVNSGWIPVGTWTVTGGASTANSISPSSGSGTLQTFLATVSDSSSQTNISGLSVLYTPGAPNNTANSCYVVFNRAAQTIGLWDDTGNTTLSTKGIGASTNLQNSQCAIGYTAMSISGTSITLSIQIQFSSTGFPGTQNVYLEAGEPNSNSGFVYQGIFIVP